MRNVRALCGSLCLATALLAIGSPGLAQEKNAQDLARLQQNPLAWRPGILYSAALQTFAVPNPISIAAVRVMAANDEVTAQLLFPDWELVLDAPPPLREKLLDLQQDDTPVPPKGPKYDKLKPAEKAYWKILEEALIDSNVVKPALFKKAAAENDWATYDHLYNQTKVWRGKVVPVEGKLLRVRKWRPSLEVQDAGIPWVYEGWIAGQTRGRPPYWVLFTTLPEGLKVAETMSRPVTFYGYFIKRVVYDAEDAKRRTLLLVGPTLFLHDAPAPPRDESPFSRDVLFMVVGGLFALALVLGGLHLYFRRGDQAIHSRLKVLRDRQPWSIGDGDDAPDAQANGERTSHRDG